MAGLRGFALALTSFVGRSGAVDEVATLLGERRLVTVTGPGGVGKTRLAGEVARRVAGQFADGVWLVELATVGEASLVPAAVAVALGIPQPPGRTVLESLAGVLAPRQVLLVLDNCEHVAAAAAELCGALLLAADDMRVLATSREPVGIAGEARYRLPPLTVPGEGDPATGSAAVALFADRARQADPHFELTGEAGPVVARLVARLDGVPLAIELAAARVESLGVAQLLDRLDDRFALLAGADRLAAARHRSLAATVDWSYRLLSEDEQRVFRRLAVFPGPFTLQAAETVAGTSAPVVLHLVDCSLLTPPRPGPDGRARYLMLETLRAYGLERLAEAGEQPDAAALARYALQVAEQAAAGLDTSTAEMAAARWLDAEDATTQQALTWALEHDHATGLRLAVALAPWWQLRGRAVRGYVLLHTASAHATWDNAWCAAQNWLGRLALCRSDFDAALGHFTAVRDALAEGAPSAELADGLAGRSAALRNLSRVPEAADDAHRALVLARELGYRAGEAWALTALSFAASYVGDIELSGDWARQVSRIDLASIPGWVARRCVVVMTLAFIESGELAQAQETCTDGLAQSREAGDLQDQAYFLYGMAELDRETGRVPDAWMHLSEALSLATRIGDRLRLIDCLDTGGHLCAATGHLAEAITLWAAHTAAWKRDSSVPDVPQEAHRRQQSLQDAERALGPAQARAAADRGAAMNLATAVEFAAMLTTLGAPEQQESQEPAALAQLSTRERELVTLVARGLTNAQIAGQLYISVRTVGSHLDRIRDKTGCRRRADLTRLALQAGLV